MWVRKIFFGILFALLLLASVHGEESEGEFDDNIYKVVEEILKDLKPDPVVAACMLEDLKDNKIVDRFYSKELLDDKEKTRQKLEPYLSDAEHNCKPPVDTKAMEDKVISVVGEVVKNLYPENQAKALCILEELKENPTIDRFYNEELLDDKKKLEKTLEPFLIDADENCKKLNLSAANKDPIVEPSGNPEAPKMKNSPGDSKSFYETPIGIVVIVAIVGVIGALLGFVIFKFVRKSDGPASNIA